MDLALQGIHRLLEVRELVKEVHAAFQSLYPIAVLSSDRKLHVFNVKEGRYAYLGSFNAPTWVKGDVLAAFPLKVNGYRMTCVVNEEVFNTLEGLVFVLHEFVHCHQFETCELRVKERLSIAKRFERDGRFDWELTYDFPYGETSFIEAYSPFLEGLEGDFDLLKRCRAVLKDVLSLQDFEYMVWVEWKEGFARFLENRVRSLLGLEENHRGREAPFNREVFYEGGALLADLLVSRDVSLYEDLEKLFWEMWRL